MSYRLGTDPTMRPEAQAPSEGRFSLRLFAAFLAVGLAFVGSSLYANWLSIEIGDEARQLTDNALPSAEHLTAAVDDLRDLEAATDELPRAPRGGATRGAARHRGPLEDVDAELDAYLALPAFPGERERLPRRAPGAPRALDGAMQRLFVDADRRPRARARDGRPRRARQREPRRGPAAPPGPRQQPTTPRRARAASRERAGACSSSTASSTA